MTRYHINHEGKVYPCRAKVLKCPYSEALHSNDKVELYYKLMGSKEAEVEPAKEGIRELSRLNRLKSLYHLSDEIKESSSPVEMVVYTLKEAITKVIQHDVGKEEETWDKWEDDAIEHVYEVLNSGYQVPSNVPENIASAGRKLFNKRRGGLPAENAHATRNSVKIENRRALARKSFANYHEYKKNKLNKENFNGTHGWLTRDFEKFAHDLNTSKMITLPIFYGDLEKARKDIKGLDDYELLSALDDYSITDKEIQENVKEANFFKYERRDDLSKEANDKMKEWYDRNRTIYQSWKINTPKRILLSLEIAEELDRRGIQRQDVSIAKMLDEGEV